MADSQLRNMDDQVWNNSILDYSSIGHFIIDEDFRVIFWNKTLENWSRINRSEILGNLINTHFPHLDNLKYMERIKNVFDGSPPYIFSSQLHKHIVPCPLPGKKTRIQQTIVSRLPTNTPGKYHAIFSIQDETNLSVIIEENKKTMQQLALQIEERIRAEKEKESLETQLRHALKMEAIGTLAGGIAHDFNNILASIIGFSEMAIEQIPKENPAHGMVSNVLGSGLRAKNIIKHILAVSRHDDKNSVPVSMADLLDDVLNKYRESLPDNIQLIQNVNSDSGLIIADSSYIKQVIMNLCLNASYVLEEIGGGTLEVSLRNADLQKADLIGVFGEFCGKPGKYVELVVFDNGPGINPEIIDKIFDPYFTTKGIGKGAGMGLAVVNGIVKKHDGFIKVNTQVGQGTSFHIFFPAIN